MNMKHFLLILFLLILSSCNKTRIDEKSYDIACDSAYSYVIEREETEKIEYLPFKNTSVRTLTVVIIDSTLRSDGSIYTIPFSMSQIESVFVGDTSLRQFYQLENIQFNITFRKIKSTNEQLNCSWSWLESRTISSGVSLGNSSNYVMWVMGSFCQTGGLAQINGNRSFITISSNNLNNLRQSAIHEMGHNLGLKHARSFINGVSLEYGDRTSPMGMSSLYQMNAPQRWMRGWMNSTQVATVISGQYELFPTDLRQGLNLIRIRNTDWVISTRKKVPPFNFTTSTLDLYKENSLYIHKFSKSKTGDETVLYHILEPGQSVVLNDKTVTNNYQINSQTVRILIQ